MSRETLLLSTADNRVIVVFLEYANQAEKQRKTLQYRQFCENISYEDFIIRYNSFVEDQSQHIDSVSEDLFYHLDAENTPFLEAEISHGNLRKQPHRYVNELNENNYSSGVMQPNTIHFDYRISDSDIPPLIKELGYQIKAQDNIYRVEYDNATNSYVVKNFNIRRATVFNVKKEISFVRNHFTLPPAEYQTMQRLIKSWDKYRQRYPQKNINDFMDTIGNDREQSLFSIYANEYNLSSHRLLSINHELTHVKNNILLVGRNLKQSAKRLSVEDYYRMEVEDERSAYLSQVVNAANIYLQKGNPDDFSMFDNEAKDLVFDMLRMPAEERFAYIQNPQVMLDAAFKSFEATHRQNYDSRQFKNNMNIKMKNVPLSALPDSDRKEFFLCRSLLYVFRIYNPQTQTFEEKNLSDYIKPEDEIRISDKNRREIIEPCRHELLNRLRDYTSKCRSGTINPQLVDEAKALMRDNLHTPRFINQINGVEIADLVDEKRPRKKEAAEIIPDKPLGWNKDIERYWKQFDGYKEITNNSKEYKFSVKESTIRYTAQDKVQISTNADYDVYDKLLQEPTNKNKPVIFKDTLTEEQALKLYVACVKNKRTMKGNIPKDLTGLKNLRGVPLADIQRCQNASGQRTNNSGAVLQNLRQSPSKAGR